MTTPAATSPIPIPLPIEDPNPPIPQDSQDAGVLSQITRPFYRVIDSVKTYIVNQFNAETAKKVSEIAQKIMQWIRENILFWFYPEGEDHIRELNKQRENLQKHFFSYHRVLNTLNTDEYQKGQRIITDLLKILDPELFSELRQELYQIFQKHCSGLSEKGISDKCDQYMTKTPFKLIQTEKGNLAPLGDAIILAGSTRFKTHHILD